MTIVSRQWIPGAAVVPQERGPEFLGVVDGAVWSEGSGFYRGFFASFFVQPGKDVWFHFPLPTEVERDGKELFLDSISLLWETEAGAKLGWICLQHGGLERIELTERLVEPDWIAKPEPIAPENLKYFPTSDRRLTGIDLKPRLPLRYGVQLCVMVSGGETGGTVRFHGAGAAFSDLA